MLILRLKNKNNIISEKEAMDEVFIDLKQYTYQIGDVIELEATNDNPFVWVQVDEAIEPSLIYVKDNKWSYEVILEESLRLAYSPKIFTGDIHYIRAWFATESEIKIYRNLSRNAHDQKEFSGAYPHAFANVETRNDSTFFARNAIDGVLANEDHGPYPYQSWGINQRKDAEITIDFGREVKVDKVALVLRGDYPHDSFWTQVTLEFSNGETHKLQTDNRLGRQIFDFDETVTTSVKLKDLIKNEDESPFPALTQLEVYGYEVFNNLVSED